LQEKHVRKTIPDTKPRRPSNRWKTEIYMIVLGLPLNNWASFSVHTCLKQRKMI
jgi:hypothetical protein